MNLNALERRMERDILRATKPHEAEIFAYAKRLISRINARGGLRINRVSMGMGTYRVDASGFKVDLYGDGSELVEGGDHDTDRMLSDIHAGAAVLRVPAKTQADMRRLGEVLSLIVDTTWFREFNWKGDGVT